MSTAEDDLSDDVAAIVDDMDPDRMQRVAAHHALTFAALLDLIIEELRDRLAV